jgi:phage terminase large subunit-like protein
MSAKYDSGLFDSDDVAEVYSNGFHAAKQTLQITVTTICPICMESLLVTKHPL